MKACLATLVLSVGLFCACASAKPSVGDAFDPGKFEEYKAKAEQGDARGQAMLGRCYATGQGVEQNPTEAVKWFRKSADQDDARGQCGLGNCFAMGMGVKKDQAEAVRWYRKAADQGDASGQFNLGRCFYSGEGVEKDAAEAVKWWRKAAEQDYADGQSKLGICHKNGEGVEKDVAEAVKWFRKAADQGDANGQFNLGVCYDTGDGVAKDHAAAVEWYRKAAEQGHAAAQYNLGRCYYQGEGVAKDAAEAVKWLHKAAEQGHATAQYSMGRCYATGEGVERDEVEAYKWMRLAVKQGNASAKQAITLLERQLTKAQRVEGRQRASAIKPLAGPGVIQAPAKRQILRIVVLPFHNATGDAAWDAWRQAFPALVRLRLSGAEFTRVPGWKTIQPALVSAGWTAAGAMDAKLARQLASELNADVVVWGSFRHLPKGWSMDARMLDLNSEEAPTELQFTSRQWLELTNSLALGLAKQLDRPIAADEQELWKMQLTDSEKAAECLAKAIALEDSKAPAAEQEQAWRDVLAADPRCGLAHAALCVILRKSEHKDDWDKAVREFVGQQPRSCGAHLALSRWLWASDDKEGSEREVREALELHPACPEALLGMSVLLIPDRLGELTKVLEQARTLRPHDPATAVFLASARAQSGNLKGARDLLDQMGELPEENEMVDLVLLNAAAAAGEIELAGRALLRLGPQAAESEAIRDTLASAKPVFPADDGSSNPPLVRPRSFEPGELDAELNRRLTAEERKLVVDPLGITPEITAEAKRLTVGLTNDMLRAWALFAEVTRRGRGAGEGGRRTADEALQDSADPQAGFSCQEYAKLYVALARALGLEAWLVHIERCADGSVGYHDCAALFLEGRGVLIDPTWRAFGIRHEAFTVLDDVQAISHQAMQPGDGAPDLQHLRMGLKLNPEDRWTRLHFVLGMAEAGECETAAAELQQVRAAGTESWDIHQAAAALEMARGRWQAALVELQRAVAINPDNAGIHSGLVKVYNHLGDLAKSSEHKERVLALDRGVLSQDSRRQLALEIGFMKASARANSDDPAVQAELQKQAKGGDVAAMMALAQACAEAQPPRSKDSVSWLLLAAKQNHAQAQYNLGIHYLTGVGVAKKDEVKAVEWLSKAAEQNHAGAQYNLGVFYLEGRGVEQDFVAAVKWFRKAAAQNHPTAQHNLGACYLQGQGVAKDEVEAVKWFRKAAEQNFAPAQNMLGACYANGLGVEQDYVEAYKWILLAAAQGDATAKQSLRLLEPKLTQQQRAEGQQRAITFKLPEVPSSDIMQGGSGGKPLADLHAKAAGGDPAAQNELGEAFQAGKLGLAKDPVEAAKWFMLAAVQNHPAAQANLGVCYEHGEGVAKHELEAYKWYLLAAAQGNENATDNASLLELLLSPDQIAEGKRRAENFKPQERTQP
jgi:TPR repeat protein